VIVLTILAALVLPVSIPAWLIMLALGSAGLAIGFLPVWVIVLALYLLMAMAAN
jgi:hypothetical protein